MEIIFSENDIKTVERQAKRNYYTKAIYKNQASFKATRDLIIVLLYKLGLKTETIRNITYFSILEYAKDKDDFIEKIVNEVMFERFKCEIHEYLCVKSPHNMQPLVSPAFNEVVKNICNSCGVMNTGTSKIRTMSDPTCPCCLQNKSMTTEEVRTLWSDKQITLTCDVCKADFLTKYKVRRKIAHLDVEVTENTKPKSLPTWIQENLMKYGNTVFPKSIKECMTNQEIKQLVNDSTGLNVHVIKNEFGYILESE